MGNRNNSDFENDKLQFVRLIRFAVVLSSIIKIQLVINLNHTFGRLSRPRNGYKGDTWGFRKEEAKSKEKVDLTTKLG